jgi:hypothetical protein
MLLGKFRDWFQYSKWRPCLRNVLPKSSVLLCLFCGRTGLNPKGIHKETFPIYSCVCRVKRFTTGFRNSLKDVQKSQVMPDRVQKWLKHQSEDLHAAGSDALVKRWDKCISVGGGYVEK